MISETTTEWEDIQVKMGNWKPREFGPTNEEIFESNLEYAEQQNDFERKKLETLNQMAEDDPDLEEDDVFEEYRKKRLEELKVQNARPRFGSLLEIGRPDFELQVTRAPKDVIVLIHLYQDHIPESVILNRLLTEIAPRHPYVKFIKIVANKCIENYLDIDVPGLLFYKNGELLDKIIPAAPVFGGKHMTKDTVEFVLAMKLIIDMEFDEDPRIKLKQFNMSTKKKSGKKNEDESDSDENEDREYTNTQMFRYKH